MILFNKNHPVLSDTNAIQIWDAFEKCEVFFFLEIPQSSFFHIDKIKTSHWIIPSLDYSTIEPHSSCKSDHFDLNNIYSSYWSFPINTQKISFNRTDNTIVQLREEISSNKRRTLYEDKRIRNSQIVKAKMSGFFFVAKYCFMTNLFISEILK